MNGKQFRRERRKARQRKRAVSRRAYEQRIHAAHDRQGSVIVVVIVLLMGLLFLGMLLFTEASQEETTAEYFAASAKTDDSKLNPDPLFEDALRQIVLGANDREYQSPFYGGRPSLLPTMFGRDRVPFSGRGVHLGWRAPNQHFVDNNRDGMPDPGQNYQGQVNQSPAATGEIRGGIANRYAFNKQPEPDVNYTSPDHASPYLFYRAPVNAGGVIRWVQLPSYHRPQLLRGRGISSANWLKDPKTAALVMRPHQEHRLIRNNGKVALLSGKQLRRFVSAKWPETGMGFFPFPNFLEGVWNGNNNTYTYDADADGNGTKEAVYLDFGLPMFTTPNGSQKFVPMIAVTVKDMDALFNLNAHGNAVKVMRADGSARPPTALSELITKSDLGASRSEVNPGYGLLTPIGGAGANDFKQHWHYFARNPATNVDLANMELWWLLTGRPEFRDVGGPRRSANILAEIPGRWGEVQRMKETFSGAGFYPRAGQTGSDDNGNRNIGGAYRSGNQVFPNQVLFPAFYQPNDYRGRGRWVQGATQRNLLQRGRHKFPAYRNYFANAIPYPVWLLPGGQQSNLKDEPWETKLWETLVPLQTKDNIYGADQTASMHLSIADRAAIGRSNDRILQLAPRNFVSSNSAETNSRQFTTESWGLKSHSRTHFFGISGNQFRNWEFTQTSPGIFEFPPRFAGIPSNSNRNPFRPDVRSLLQIVSGDRNNKRPQRKLSMNGIVDRNPVNGRLRIRPLTPHPANLPATAVSGSNSVLGATRFNVFRPEQIGFGMSYSAQRQEWLARYDRQRFCRDIFVMLYVFGGGRDINYTLNNSTNQIYSAVQLREMAQMAVNWVDQIDPDDSITKFEYDKNLANGWNLNDDPFDNDGFAPYPKGTPQYNANFPEESAARGVVYGVESQKLTFSEAMAVLARKVVDGTGQPVDHPATEYDDRKHRRFLYLELQNSSPNVLRFNDNNQYQIVIRESNPNLGPALRRVEERRLTLRDGVVSAPTAGSDLFSRFTIGTGGDVENRAVDTMNLRTGVVLPSFFKVNPKHGDADDPNLGQKLRRRIYTKIAPRDLLDFDLLKVNNNRYRINQMPGTSIVGDGQEIQRITTVTPQIPSGANLLKINNPDGIRTRFSVRVLLRRRLNANRQPPKRNLNGTDPVHFRESNDNPWVTVDEIRMPVNVFTLADTTKTSQLRTQLQNVRSLERLQPLARRPLPVLPGHLFQTTGSNPGNPALSPNVYRFNSLGGGNRASGLFPTPFTLWQPHFNRDFSSLTDAFNIPLYGPHELTRRLGTGSTVNNKVNWASTAGVRFLRPDLPVPGAGVVNSGNRWYRVLSLFEVPEPNPNGRNPNGAPGINPWFVTDVGRKNALGYYRTAGKINLNTLRHPSVLAGLLDAPNTLTYLRNGPVFLRDGNSRDWWTQFLRARDGIDPLGTGLPLPGVPGASKPFRELGSNLEVNGNQSLQHTILRSLPQDGTGLGVRRLFELGSSNQHKNRQNFQNIDFTTRYRLLSKVMNNSTTRSNVFVIFMQMDFFQAKEVTSDSREKVVRVGAKLPSSPGYRVMFVIDRSRALDIVKPNDLPRITGTAPNQRFTFSLNQNLDYSRLVKHRQRIK